MTKKRGTPSPPNLKGRKRKHQTPLTSFFSNGSRNKNDVDGSLFSYNSHPHLVKMGRLKNSHGLNVASDNDRESRFGVCPICQYNFPLHLLHQHTELCITNFQGKNSEEKLTVDSDIETNGNFASSKMKSTTTKNTEGEMDKSGVATSLEKETKPKISQDSNKCSTSNGNNNPTQVTCWWKQSKEQRTRETSSHLQSKDQKTTTETPYQYENKTIAHASEPIPGLFIYQDFITPKEEELILACLDDDHDGTGFNLETGDFVKQVALNTQPTYNFWKKQYFNGHHFGKRWGVHCNLRDRKVSAPQHPLPNFLINIIIPRLQLLDIFAKPNQSDEKPFPSKRKLNLTNANEANAIDYRRHMGHSLTAHVDDRQMSKEPIANISLLGDCFMTFKNERKMKGLSSKVFPAEKKVLLQRRTLQVLTGKARYDYSHGIRKEDILSERRVSITIRESPLTS